MDQGVIDGILHSFGKTAFAIGTGQSRGRKLNNPVQPRDRNGRWPPRSGQILGTANSRKVQHRAHPRIYVSPLVFYWLFLLRCTIWCWR